jgi:hypothetical protein
MTRPLFKTPIFKPNLHYGGQLLQLIPPQTTLFKGLELPCHDTYSNRPYALHPLPPILPAYTDSIPSLLQCTHPISSPG